MTEYTYTTAQGKELQIRDLTTYEVSKALEQLASIGASRCSPKFELMPLHPAVEFKQYYSPILTLKSPGLELPEYSTERDMERHLNRQFCTLLAGLLRHYEEVPTTPIPDRITVDVESDNASVHFRMDCWVEPVG